MTSIVTTQKTEDLKDYIEANKGTCRDCKIPLFWCKTSSGRRIPMDFPDQILRGKIEPTHELVLTYDEDGFTGEVTALAYKSKATHTTHLDTCEGKR